ncbi:MAG: DUF1501 domain-containing protein [Verrucomicrobiales bacterium]
MLSIAGHSRSRFCDGFSRRDFLRIGSLGMGGLALPGLLQAEEKAKVGSSGKAIIMIYMAGAPPHQDLYDLKTEAPSEIRGEFSPIKTNVPGIEICELLPRPAKITDKLALIRVDGAPNGSHDSFMCYTGRAGSSLIRAGSRRAAYRWERCLRPARVARPGNPRIRSGLAPARVTRPMVHRGAPGFLGPGLRRVQALRTGAEDMVLNGVTLDRLGDRERLLGAFDNFRRSVDQSGRMEGMDAFNQQAFGMLTSSRLAEALNLDNESPKVRERYGKGDPKNFGDGAPRNLEHFLLARRLVEAGARCVTLNFGRWDFHSQNLLDAQEACAALRPGLERADRGPARARHGQGCLGRRLGRIRQDAKDQRRGGSRPLVPNVLVRAARSLAECTWLVTGATDKIGGEPAMPQSTSAKSSPRSIKTSASTPTKNHAPRPQRFCPHYLRSRAAPPDAGAGVGFGLIRQLGGCSDMRLCLHVFFLNLGKAVVVMNGN